MDGSFIHSPTFDRGMLSRLVDEFEETMENVTCPK
jgi:hypothetical protein